MKRILLIEDDLQLRNLLCQTLENGGYNVATAVNAVDGWQRMADCPSDLVIADLEMHQMDGLEMAYRMRSAYGKQLKVVLYSSPERIRAQQIDTATVDAVLLKPVVPAALLALARELLAPLNPTVAM